MIVASVGYRAPLIRQLMGWIGCILANRGSIRAALGAGDSVAVFPGGIAEMVRTDASSERLVLQGRKGFVKLALEQGVPIVPVYVFGQSLLWSHLRLPGLEAISRALRTALILPYGRFGLLVPRRLPLLYAIGEPICGGSHRWAHAGAGRLGAPRCCRIHTRFVRLLQGSLWLGLAGAHHGLTSRLSGLATGRHPEGQRITCVPP